MSLATFDAYQQARSRVQRKTHDFKDELIVALWERTAKALDAVEDMKKQLDEMEKGAAQSAEALAKMTMRIAQSKPNSLH